MYKFRNLHVGIMGAPLSEFGTAAISCSKYGREVKAFCSEIHTSTSLPMEKDVTTAGSQRAARRTSVSFKRAPRGDSIISDDTSIKHSHLHVHQ